MVLLSTSYDHNLTFSKSQATRQTTQTQQIGLEKKTEEKVEKFTVRAGKISGPTVRGYTLRPPKKHVEERVATCATTESMLVHVSTLGRTA
jgi:hypothetical protein